MLLMTACFVVRILSCACQGFMCKREGQPSVETGGPNDHQRATTVFRITQGSATSDDHIWNVGKPSAASMGGGESVHFSRPAYAGWEYQSLFEQVVNANASRYLVASDPGLSLWGGGKSTNDFYKIDCAVLVGKPLDCQGLDNCVGGEFARGEVGSKA